MTFNSHVVFKTWCKSLSTRPVRTTESSVIPTIPRFWRHPRLKTRDTIRLNIIPTTISQRTNSNSIGILSSLIRFSPLAMRELIPASINKTSQMTITKPQRWTWRTFQATITSTCSTRKPTVISAVSTTKSFLRHQPSSNSSKCWKTISKRSTMRITTLPAAKFATWNRPVAWLRCAQASREVSES